METPLAPTSYAAWELPERRITAVRSHEWLVAGRLGPQARGDATNYIQRVDVAPPDIRRPSLCEAMDFFRAPLQTCVPATQLRREPWINRHSLHWTYVAVGATRSSDRRGLLRAAPNPPGAARNGRFLRLLRKSCPYCSSRYVRSRIKRWAKKPGRSVVETLAPLGAAVFCRPSSRKFRWRLPDELGLGGKRHGYYSSRAAI